MRVGQVSDETDVALIGCGIMSATLGVLIQQAQPDWSITAYERLEEVGAESSYGWNNAGTGHAGLCELNYTPERGDGTIDVAKAVRTNERFQESLQFWAHLVQRESLPSPERFVTPVPHLSFVSGERDVAFLRKRFDALADRPLFESMQYTEDRDLAADWVPVMMRGRDDDAPIAMTRLDSGTDVNFGALTKYLLAAQERGGANLVLNTEVTNLRRLDDGRWQVEARHRQTGERSRQVARFVFIGAGGYAIHLLQKAGIPEARGYGGFPVGGQFLRCTNPDVVAMHNAKVYGKSQAKAPPMTMPHLDRRVLDGKPGVLFGPYAGFSLKYLKRGSWSDLIRSIKPDNLLTMLTVAKDEFGLTRYLIGQVRQDHEARVGVLRNFVPTAHEDEWELYDAGVRVQTMKRTATRRGAIEYGTDVVAASDGTLAGLMGASPGASTATSIMLDVMRRCFPELYPGWVPRLRELVPSIDVSLSDDQVLREDVRGFVEDSLGLATHAGAMIAEPVPAG